MGGASLPPGFRFHPTDEELLGYYLKRKVEGLQIELEVIPEIEFYKFDPWELPDKSFLPNRDMEWFFFCPRDRKYPNGSRTNRATKAGYWKATGKDRKVVCQSALSGYRKTLVFYQGRAPLGDRTNWVMHEYRLCDDLSKGSPNQGAFALCRVVKKNEHTRKKTDSPERKRMGSSSSSGELTSKRISNEPLSVSGGDIASQVSDIASPHGHEVNQVSQFRPVSKGHTNPTDIWISPDLILDSSKEYSQTNGTTSKRLPRNELPASMTPRQHPEQRESSCNSSYSNIGEMDQADGFSQIGCLSPYSGHANYMEFYGNESILYEDYDQGCSFDYPTPF